MFSDDSFISFIAWIISRIHLLLSSASLLAWTTISFTSAAFCALSFVLFAISVIEAEISCMALACSDEPCASVWLAAAICSEPVVIWFAAFLIFENAILLSAISFTIAFPTISFSDFGWYDTVISPSDISFKVSAWFFRLSTIAWNPSTRAPTSLSILEGVISTSTSPADTFFATPASSTSGLRIVVIINQNATNALASAIIIINATK